MNTVRLGITTLLLASGTSFVFAANADDSGSPAPADSAALAADGGAPDADLDADLDADAAPPPPPAYNEKPFPEEKSPRPKKDEWQNAGLVSLEEDSITSGSWCKIQRIREWIRIYCPTTTAKITLMCGAPEDVYLSMDPVPQDWGIFPQGGEVIFAVRKGDRRLFEWQGVEFGYKGANTAISFLVISEMWLPGEEKPVIMAR